MQSLALQITTVLLLLLTACFVWVLRRTRGTASLHEVTEPAYRLRGRLFMLASVFGVLIALLTLTPWPHDAHADAINRSINVKARQWAWELSEDKLRLGETVEFKVESLDVNHGFALYDPDKRIVAQIQAMPGFVNKVRYRFDRPGTYQILCLEYCGVAHHGMVADIVVEAGAAQ
jgi:cytochrome c oxidase subunit II